MSKQKNKSTEVAVVDQNRLAALKEKTGATEGEGATWLPKLKVNRTPIDDDNNQLPMGKYHTVYQDVDHYMDTVDVIVLAKATQFMRFEKLNNKMHVECTMLEDGYQPQYKDTLGGTRLGRVPGMAKEDMTDAQKDAKFFFHILALADVSNAVDREGKALYAKGEEVFAPISLQFSGRKAVEMQGALRKMKKKGEAYFEFNVLLNKPSKEKVGDNIFYSFDITRGDNSVISNDLLDSIEAASNIIEVENKRIYSRYLKAQQEGADIEDDADYTDLDIVEGN